MKVSEIREAFLAYFSAANHSRVPSSSLVPEGDDTLLFTNAGMVQFKDLFLGLQPCPYTRATSSQRCVRAGGKHNDLENVGYTVRHHTFFEMLGNFSFGDYFKKEAITFAWKFLTEELKIPQEKLWVTVYIEDDETAQIWLQDMGIDKQRFSRCGEKDNFWSMGDTGPCGPCTEIFYDHGEQVPGGPPGSPDEDGDRYVEIWNLVFMQFDRASDGALSPLPKPSVDTGMGLERIAAVMQGVHSNYDIDLFKSLIKSAAKVTGTPSLDAPSLKVIADHIRACAFLITDGVVPSNEGRGYVLRRIVRRAVRHGHQLGCEGSFFHLLVPTLVAEMGEAYPELAASKTHVETVLKHEEEQFARTLTQGMRILEESLASAKDRCLSGEVAFKLYDTYGFPVDLTADIARERGFSLDREMFEKHMGQQRARAKAASQFDTYQTTLHVKSISTFTGYETLEQEGHVESLFREGKEVPALTAGETGIVVLDKSAFYAESGGQVGDTGLLESSEGIFEVQDTKQNGQAICHIGLMKSGEFRAGSIVNAKVDRETRQATRLNHSATHLLHAALRQTLGEHVMQKGSQVSPEHLRFDFSHMAALTEEEREKITDLVNEQIRLNSSVTTTTTSPDEAKAQGAMALFGEKYGDEVRVLSMGQNFSVELCGGTHVERTGDIGVFVITAEMGVAAGIRRIEALTGQAAFDWFRQSRQTLLAVAAALKADPDSIAEKVRQLQQKNRQLEKDNTQLQAKAASQTGTDLASQAVSIKGKTVLVKKLEGANPKALRSLLDQLKQQLGSAIIVLALSQEKRVSLIVGVTDDLTEQVSARNLVSYIAAQVGGKGGGRADMAQAGGSHPEHLESALASVPAWLEEKL